MWSIYKLHDRPSYIPPWSIKSYINLSSLHSNIDALIYMLLLFIICYNDLPNNRENEILLGE